MSDENAPSVNMERILKAMNQAVPDTKRILEINSNHDLIKYLKNLFDSDKTNPIVGEYAQLLYDQALLTEGSQIKDPVNFARQLSRLMLKAAKS